MSYTFKCRDRSVQRFLRLLDTNKQTPRQACKVYIYKQTPRHTCKVYIYKQTPRHPCKVYIYKQTDRHARYIYTDIHARYIYTNKHPDMQGIYIQTDRQEKYMDRYDWTMLVKHNSKNISYFFCKIKITVHLKCIYLNISGFKS